MIQYFILGILTVYIVLPIIDSILAVILALLELIKGLISLKIADINDKISAYEEKEDRQSRPIGFMANIETEMEECDSEAEVL